MRFKYPQWQCSNTQLRFLAGMLVAFVACASPPPEGDDDGSNVHIDGGLPAPSCDSAGKAAAQPFGTHTLSYTQGSILPDHVSQEDLDQSVRNFYNVWKTRFLREGCGDGRVYVATGMGSSLTVSEAHGYGMVLLAYMAGHEPDAQRLFDGMFLYFRDHPTSESANLMAWSQDESCASNQGEDSASDGDLDVAYALLLADKQWGSGGTIDYRAEAVKVISAIRNGDVDPTSSYVLLGNWVSAGSQEFRATRSSDFMPGHFASFAAATGDLEWGQLLDSEYGIVATVQETYASSTGLLPDFILDARTAPQPAPPGFLENDADGQYSYNASRDPWRLGVHYLITGDTRARAALDKINAWVKGATGGDPGQIKAGYALDGSPIRTYYDHAFGAPFGVGAMVDSSHQDWLNALWDATLGDEGDANYFGDTLKLLSMIVMSGNWWAPEAAPCPQ